MDEIASDVGETPSLMALALAFNAVALRSVGGGLIALTQRMIVDERRWLSEEQYLSASAICGILPGANQINLAVFVGTRYRGFAGAIAAVAGLVVLPACAAIAINLLYLRFRDAPGLLHGLAGMSCAAVGLTAAVAVRQARQVVTAVPPGLIAAATFAASALLHVPLLVTLIVLGPLGFWWAWRARAANHDGAGVRAAP